MQSLDPNVYLTSDLVHNDPLQNQLCLILTNGFYEWKWLDEKGKKKEKFLICIEHNALFSFAGLWSTWINPLNKKIIKTYTILTTQANTLMSEIHNSTKRMPIILTQETENNWLTGSSDFEINHNLIATSLQPRADLFS